MTRRPRSNAPRTKVVIWGASGHAMVVVDIIRLAGEYEVVGFLDDFHPERRGTWFCGAPVLGGGERLDALVREGVRFALVAIGDCGTRLRLASVTRARGLELAAAIHPAAVIARGVPVGSGTVIAAGAVVGPGARLGENVIVNTSASIDHECVVGDGAHVGPGVRLGGGVVLGRGAWVGIGAAVIEGVRIGPDALIGAGAVVLRDVPAGVVAHGVPARVIRRRTAADE